MNRIGRGHLSTGRVVVASWVDPVHSILFLITLTIRGHSKVQNIQYWIFKICKARRLVIYTRKNQINSYLFSLWKSVFSSSLAFKNSREHCVRSKFDLKPGLHWQDFEFKIHFPSAPQWKLGFFCGPDETEFKTHFPFWLMIELADDPVWVIGNDPNSATMAGQKAKETFTCINCMQEPVSWKAR